MKNNKGFSLIELMVVVAIIGILASIAVPNFQRFQRRARQSEARTQLGALYTAQVAFRTEYQSYYTGLKEIGYAPEGVMLYNVGFTQENLPTVAVINAIAGNSVTLVSAGWNDTNEWCASGDPSANCTGAANGLPATASAADTFTAGAAGALGSGTDDQWQITQAKVWNNIQSGL